MSYPTFVVEHRKARASHRCSDCGRTIRPGETYRRGVGFDGNRVDVHKWTTRGGNLWPIPPDPNRPNGSPCCAACDTFGDDDSPDEGPFGCGLPECRCHSPFVPDRPDRRGTDER